MKYEPLKGKICRLVDAPWDVDEEERAFDFRDVKSAVQGLLQEIENTDLLVLEELDFIDRNNLDPEEIVVNTLEYVKWLIKKWFADVIDKKEER